MNLSSRQKRTILGCLLLCALAFPTFWKVAQNGFINYDDPDYVTKNPHVLTGLTGANVIWAFSTTGSFYWQPLTWLSHMLDVQLFGLNPRWHHLVSLLLHTANTVVLFLLLQRVTGAMWRSLFVAAFFAVHPLHVESVAWVAERKDVLSTLLFLLTIWAYTRYAEEREGGAGHPEAWPAPSGAKVAEETAPSPFDRTPAPPHQTGPAGASRRAQSCYVAALTLYALGLMCKPMLVTVPFALLLLDYWPLRRFNRSEARKTTILAQLVWEKAPFLGLAAIACLVTLLATAKSHAMVGGLPFDLRVSNAIAAYLQYLGKMIWPAHLAAFYPHPDTRYFAPHNELLYPASEQWPAWQIVAAALLLSSLSALVFLRRRSEPWLFTGWYWYLVTLVPVIGLVQAGMQGMADRFTYIPLVGIFLALAWSATELSRGRRFVRSCFVGGSIVLLAGAVLVTREQVSYWHDDRTLFSHALAVTSRNPVAEWMIGSQYAAQGELGLAQSHFRLALAADPYQVEARSALGSLFELEGRTELATNEYRMSLRMKPGDEFARVHLAGLLRKLGRPQEALAEYEEAARWNPDSVEANYQAGALLLDAGDLVRAASYLETTLRLKPDHADALLCLSDLRSQQGRSVEALAALREVVRLYPTNFELRVNLGSMLWKAGLRQEALTEYREALRLSPSHPMIHYDLGTALFAQGQLVEADKELSEAVRLKPDYLEAATDLGRVLTAEGKFQEAQAAFRRAQQLSATNRPAQSYHLK